MNVAVEPADDADLRMWITTQVKKPSFELLAA